MYIILHVSSIALGFSKSRWVRILARFSEWISCVSLKGSRRIVNHTSQNQSYSQGDAVWLYWPRPEQLTFVEGRKFSDF